MPPLPVDGGGGGEFWLIDVKDGGRGRIRDAIPVREVVEELAVHYQIIMEYNNYFYGFQRNAFPKKCLPQKAFQRNAFNKMLSMKCRKITM